MFLSLSVLPLRGDHLPLHTLPTHLDPFNSPCEVAANPGCGETLAPFTAGTPQVGADGLNSVFRWHWQTEIDVVDFTGFALVWVNFGLPGQAGPFPATFGPGWDIIVDLHQEDQANSTPGMGPIPFLNVIGNTCLGGGGEVGAVCKQFVNATQYQVAYGVAVQEGPDTAPIMLPVGGGVFGDADGGPRRTLTLTSSDGQFFLWTTEIPEPSTLAMLGIGTLFLLLGKRTHRSFVA